MRFKLWNREIVLIFFSMLIVRCVNEPPQKIHQVLHLSYEKREIALATTVPKEYSIYKIKNDKCTVNVSYNLFVNDADVLITNYFEIMNESGVSGTFSGKGTVPTSVLPDSILNSKKVFIAASVRDETEHEISASVTVN